MLRSRRLLVATGALALLTALAGCSRTVHVEPAAAADDPACADVSVLLPDAIDDLDRVWTDAQATGAWGDPTVVLRCGVDVPAPSELICQTIGGVDWLVLAQEEKRQRLVSYGRDPAVEIIIKRGSDVDFRAIVESLANKIRPGLQSATAACTSRTG
ncbi:DUF3515 family protein [Microbacterium sp.]|uniref:DUF3515 family protein n=1 Tax=Microbacterium sp. TaxID=51671 RepID=UPI0039E3846B